ncbi:MAG: TolC family protein [Bacteroidota bacterium]
MYQYLLGFIFLSLSLNVTAQSTLSLSDAIQLGLANNYQIQIAERNIDIAQNNNNWKAAGRYPTVNFTAGLNNTFTGQKNPASFLSEFTSLGSGLTAGIDAGYTIFDGYTVRINKKRLEALEKQSQGNAQIAIENTIEQIINAYQNVLIQQEAVKTLEELLKISNDRIAYQTIRQEYGQAGRFDLLQTEEAYLNDSTSYLVQLNTLDLAFRNLNLTMGVDDMEQRYELTDELSYSAEQYSFEDLQSKMFDNNRNLKNLYTGLTLANIEKESARSFQYPTIRVNGGATYGANISGLDAPNVQFEIETPVTSSNYSLYANLSASYNLYNGGATKRQIQNAEVQEKIAQLNIEDLKRNLSSQLSNALANYNNQRQLLALTQSRVENARENLDIAETRFRTAQINSFDYRTIQLNYLNAVQAQLQAIFNLRNTETLLVKLTGGLIR